MKMKPTHFTLIRFHHAVTSKYLQHPGNKGKNLRNIQKLKGQSSYGLPVFLFLKKISSLLFFQQLKTALKKNIRADNKNSQAKCSPAVP